MDIAHPVPARRGSAGTSRDPDDPAAAVLEALPCPAVLLAPDGTVLRTNRAWLTVTASLGYPGGLGAGSDYVAAVLRTCGEVVGRRVVTALQALARGEARSVAGDHPVEHPSGTRWFHLRATRAGLRGHVVVTHTDATHRVRSEHASAWQARHDDLTHLPNRAALRELVDDEMQRPDAPAVTVLLLDVDAFRDVNDSLGRAVGDDLLCQIARRLVAGTRPEDSVGRLGGDEFAVVCRDCDATGGQALAERLRAMFDEPFVLGGRATRLTASIGVASSRGPADGTPSADLVGDADLAMAAAKRGGRNRVRVFSADLRDAVRRKVQVAAELREAIDADQLVLHYEPVVHLRSGRVHGVEALVRWQHPERGLLPPAEFIGVAESSDLIVPLTRWVLAAATRQAARWAEEGLPLVVSVNISAASLVTGTMVDDVAAALAQSCLPPGRLVVELTETAVAEDPGRAAEQFAALRRSGVEVAIDDFGSGFSSLGQLVTIPAGILKIDRSLVAGAGDRGSPSAAAVGAVVALARAVGMRALAEGVETADQLAVAAALGCALAQGHHVGRPMPAADLLRWVRAREVDEPRAGHR